MQTVVSIALAVATSISVTRSIEASPQGTSSLFRIDAEPATPRALLDFFGATQKFEALFQQLDSRFPGLAKRSGPLRVRLFGDRDRYREAGGGAHTTTIRAGAPPQLIACLRGASPSKKERTELYEAVVRLAIRQRPEFENTAPSPWLEFGIATYIASVPAFERGGTQRPTFRFLDEPRIQHHARASQDLFRWQRLATLSVTPSPLELLAHGHEKTWTKAIDPEGELDPVDLRKDLRDHAYAIVVYFDVSFSRHQRPIFDKALGAELRGKRGLDSFVDVTQKEKKRLPLLFRSFAARTASSLGHRLPGAAKLDAWVQSWTGGVAFADGKPRKRTRDRKNARTADAKAHEKGPAKTDPKSVLDPAVQARVTETLAFTSIVSGRLDFEPPNEKPHATTAVRDMIRAMLDTASKSPKKLGIPLWDEGRYRRFYMAAGTKPGHFKLSRKGAPDREVAWIDLPPHLLAEAALRSKLVDLTPKLREGLGILLARQLPRRNEVEQKRMLKRAKKKGIQPVLPAFLSRALAAQDAIDACESTISTMPIQALETLVTAARKFVDDANSRGLLATSLPTLLEKAGEFAWMSELSAKVDVLESSKVRVHYDWKDKKQAADWLAVQKSDRFTPHLQYGGGTIQVRVDPRRGELLAFGPGAMRHRLQFEGDIAVEWHAPIRTQKTETMVHYSFMPFGAMMICARLPNWYLSASFRSLIFAGAEGTKPQAFDAKLQKAIQMAVVERRPLTLARTGNRVEFSEPKNSLATRTLKVFPEDGAVVWLQPFAAKRDGSACAACGPLTITGTPTRSSRDALTRPVIETWRARFDRLLGQ